MGRVPARPSERRRPSLRRLSRIPRPPGGLWPVLVLFLAAAVAWNDDTSIRAGAAAVAYILIYLTGYFDGRRTLATDLLRNRGDNREPPSTQ